MTHEPVSTAAAGDDVTAIKGVLAAYAAALNASDTSAVMPLYAADGVFMDCYSPSAVGTAAIRAEYDRVFKLIALHVTFDVAEVVVAGPEWAFARTNSAGKVTVHATGAESTEGNQELFVMRKAEDGVWKIARYCFSPTNPPAKP